MKKILIVNTVPFGMGGMSSVIVNYIENMNKAEMEITMLVNSRIEKVYEDKLRANGINIIILKRNSFVISYMYKLFKIMKEVKFDIIHVHGNSATMAFEIIPAYFAKIPKRIIHSHNVSCKHTILNKLLWPILKKIYTEGMACSREAGKWLFRERDNFIVLNNAINLQKYEFKSEIRNRIRKELEVENSYVIGHVGYFNEQKNHEKLFEIVKCLKNKINVELVCVSGNKEIPENINELINKYEIKNNIRILLRRDNVNEILQGMDCFVFPSKFEGLGLALIEAQATGVRCIVSDKVPETAKVCKELIDSFSLEDDSSKWGDAILDKDKYTKSREERSKDSIIKLRKSGYDIETEAKKLRQVYIGK